MVAFVVAGCGGNVVVDVSQGGAGGSGGAATGPTTATGQSSGTSAGGCGTASCAVTDIGACTCDGECNAQKLRVECAPIQGGASCDCFENGIKIAVCVEAGAASCDVLSGCCAAQFFGQGGG